jgi:hypothetical protein
MVQRNDGPEMSRSGGVECGQWKKTALRLKKKDDEILERLPDEEFDVHQCVAVLCLEGKRRKEVARDILNGLKCAGDLIWLGKNRWRKSKRILERERMKKNESGT